MKHVISLLLALLCLSTANAQIVNIEKKRFVTDTVGWAGGIFGGGSYLHNVNEIIAINAGSHVQHKTERDLWLFLTNYNLVKVEQTDFDQSAYGHLRYNRKINDKLRWETFAQGQYNEVNRIKLRILVGTGPRLKLLENEKLKLYIASLPMFENEKLTGDPLIEMQTSRLSNYLSISLNPAENVSLSGTTYYQPRIAFFKDFRLLTENNLEVSLSDKLALESGLTYAYDAFPALDAPKFTTYFQMGLSLGFN